MRRLAVLALTLGAAILSGCMGPCDPTYDLAWRAGRRRPAIRARLCARAGDPAGAGLRASRTTPTVRVNGPMTAAPT